MSYPTVPHKILFNGDSICIGLVETGSWSTRISEWLGIPCPNYARGGGTITADPPPLKSGHARHTVYDTLGKMHEEHPDADYIIIEGGTNDADLFDDEIREGKPCRLGHLDPLDFGGSYDVRTFTGALEDVFYRAIALWPNARIGYIVAQKMGVSRHSQYNRRRYFDRAVAVCRKWGIPYIDLWESCPLNPCHPAHYFPETKGEENRDKNIGYYIDGQHMTARGYDLTADLVLKWIKTI